MRMPNSAVQRQCASSSTPDPTGECEEYREKCLSLQRYANHKAEPNTVRSLVYEDLRSSDFGEWHNHNAERCPGGNVGTLATIWQNDMLWCITTGADALARGEFCGNNIASTQCGYDQNVSALARTLKHEGGHNFGIQGGDPHWRTDQIATCCNGSIRKIFLFPYLLDGSYFGEYGDVESGDDVVVISTIS
jgi:hypothetical protein